jgi:multimeric flavodoxin WrbA
MGCCPGRGSWSEMGQETMKVVAIEGSPHRGNTHARVQQFGDVLCTMGNIEFEHLPLRELEIRPCRGCFVCFLEGEESCPLNDDVATLRDKIEEADATVFATPVYSMHVSYLMKQFVDRFAYTFHRPRYFDKYAVGLAVSGGVGLKEALGYVEMFSGAWGFDYVSGLRYADPPRGSGFPRFAREKDRTREVARRVHYLLMNRPLRRLRRDDYMFFHIMRAVYNRMEPFSPTDYDYWKRMGWLEPGTRYFTPRVKTNALLSLYPRLVAWLMGRAIDRQLRADNSRPSESG